MKKLHSRIPSSSISTSLQKRSGVAIVWVIVAMPVLVVSLSFMTEVAIRWVALEELRTAASAGALAGAESWGEGSNDRHHRRHAHFAAKAFTEANKVLGQQIHIDANNDNSAVNNNENRFRPILLGNVRRRHFQPNRRRVRHRGCLVTASVEIPSFWRTFSSAKILTITAVAVYDEETGQAKLINISGIDD